MLNWLLAVSEVDTSWINLSNSSWLTRHMLTIVDNEEFYEQEKPLSLKDIRCLIIILRQVMLENLHLKAHLEMWSTL